VAVTLGLSGLKLGCAGGYPPAQPPATFWRIPARCGMWFLRRVETFDEEQFFRFKREFASLQSTEAVATKGILYKFLRALGVRDASWTE
jgi:hypothetical protein